MKIIRAPGGTTVTIIGARYTFRYPEIFVTLPDYSAHRNQEVTVLRQLTPDE